MAAPLRPPPTQRVYDVCVLGGGPGGCAAGALLARRGLRVLLLDPGGLAPRPDGGWLLPVAPGLAPGVRQLPAAEALLGELGLQSEAARTQEPLVPDLQLLLPRGRLELCRDEAARATELRREWPADAARLEEGLRQLAGAARAGAHFLQTAPPLPPAGLLDRLAVRRALQAAAQAVGVPRDARPLAPLAGHPLAEALLSLPGFLGHLEGPPSPLAVARLCGTALRGLHRPAAGGTTLEEALRRRVAETRGELLGSAADPAKVGGLGLEGSRLTTIRIAGTNDAYLARAFILAAPLEWLLGLLPTAAADRGRARLPALRPGRRLASLHLVVRPSALPPGLGAAALVLAQGATANEAVLLEVAAAHRDPAHGGGATGEGERLLSLWTLAATGAGADGASAARLEAALTGLLPFCGRHLVHRSAPGPVPHLMALDRPGLGVAGLPTRTPWKNLFLGGREVVPGLGLEGELHAGLQAAAQVAAFLGIKERPR